MQIPEPFRSLPRLSSPPDSLGILRSLLTSFSDCVSTVMTEFIGHDDKNTVNHIFLCLLLPIEIVVRKFRSLPAFFPFSASGLCYGPHDQKVATVLTTSPSLTSVKNLAQIVNHIFLCLLLPIEIVVRKFRFDNFFIRLTLSFALPLIYSLSIVNELGGRFFASLRMTSPHAFTAAQTV